MKKSIRLIILLSSILFFFTCSGDLLEEGPGDVDHLTIEKKLRGIWIIGGLSDNLISSTVSSVDLYDPVTGIWYSNVTSLPTPVSFAAVASANGNIYVIGGFQGNGTIANLNQIYNVSSNSWSSGTVSGFSPRANIYGAESDDKIYLLGGTTADAGNPWAVSTTITQYYNINTNTWTTGLATTGSDRFAMSYNGIIYHLGGRTAAATLATTHDGYTCSSNTLTAAVETALSTARVGMAGAIYAYSDGYVTSFAIGGATAITGCTTNYVFNTTLTTYTTTNIVQYMYYSPILTIWTTMTKSLPIGVAFGSAAIYGSTLYYFGGNAGASPIGLAGVYSLDISTRGSYGSWATLDNIPHARFGHAAVTINQ